MKDFGIFATEAELEKSEQLAKESEMEYVRTEKLNAIERLLYRFDPAAPDIYCVIVSGTEEQFDNLVNSQKGEMTRIS